MSKFEEIQKRIVFQQRFAGLVEDEDLEKTQLAKNIGISYSTFSRAYNNGVIPKIKVLILIADYFQVSLDFLLNYTDDPTFCPAIIQKCFYERLTELRLLKGIKTDYMLAKELLIPKQYVYHWANTKQLPTLNNLEEITFYFNVSLDVLLGRSDLNNNFLQK